MSMINQWLAPANALKLDTDKLQRHLNMLAQEVVLEGLAATYACTCTRHTEDADGPSTSSDVALCAWLLMAAGPSSTTKCVYYITLLQLQLSESARAHDHVLIVCRRLISFKKWQVASEKGRVTNQYADGHHRVYSRCCKSAKDAINSAAALANDYMHHPQRVLRALAVQL